MGKRFKNKLKQLDRLKEILLANPQGLRKAELARRLDVHRSTIPDYIDDLGYLVPVYEPIPDHYAINREMYTVEVHLTLDEAVALHLASRLLATRTDKYDPHAAKALRALGTALEEMAPLVSEHLRRSAGVLDGDHRRHDPVFTQVVEQLTRAWAQGRKVRVQHQMDEGDVYEYTFAPYFLEPYGVGRTLHVIGHRWPPDALRTFKVERIRTVELLDEPYEIPPDFDPREQLKDAWGIWYTDDEPQEVILRFSRRVAHRVRETKWHHAEETRELPDGGLEWRAPVAAWQEMVPWIRGWGADCEVLAPKVLRRKIVHSVQRQNAIYKIRDEATSVPVHLLPYAKTDPDTNRIHRLLYHLIDVGQVALLMWQQVLTGSVRRHIAEILDLEPAETGRLLAFLIALHDLGKASPAYQAKYAPAALKKELAAAGLSLSGYSLKTMQAYHSAVTTWALNEYETLVDELGMNGRFARKVARALGGHHGIWPGLGETDLLYDDEQWQSVREDLIWHLKGLFDPPVLPTWPDTTQCNAFLTWLSGFTSVADWVGSIEDYFPLEEQPLQTRHYSRRAREQAKKALTELGWIGWQPRQQQLSFQEMFPFIQEVRPLQQAVIDAAANLPRPALLILEAPTGIGKTEAALYLADTWLQADGGRGLYVAMPTQATGNQMFERTQAFLAGRYPDDLVNLQLIHGQALWSEAMEEIQLHTVGEEANGSGRIAAMSWFNRQRKRTLLAPFGVGTVDQALMSILQTKHFFVRLFGLGHKVVIFDEIHAYDTYMNTLFHRLLAWLRELGVSVIMLSATLPRQTRREMVQEFSDRTLSTERDIPAYPALTVAPAEGAPGTIPLVQPDDITLKLRWLDHRDPSAVVAYLEEALADGGCAAVICNTVRRAQAIYQALQNAKLEISEENLILFHARFPPVWRQEIEEKVLQKFGKPGAQNVVRPHKAIVVATQVIEQSLDLDFDVMVTALAPIDLLLQRAGRLHRHPRGQRRHPRRLTIIPPRREGELPRFTRADVYEPHFLLRTVAVLRSRSQIALPSDTSALIEAVYGPLEKAFTPSETWEKAVAETADSMQNVRREAAGKATLNLVFGPDNAGLLNQSNVELEEEDPTVYRTFRAQTRDIDPGVTLICLHRHGNRVTLDPEAESDTVNLEVKPLTSMVRQLLQRAVTVHHWSILDHFLEREAPTAWQQHSALRYTRLALFDDGLCRLPGTPYYLTLSREYGLAIHKEEN